MSTVITHAITAVAMGRVYTGASAPLRFWGLSVLCACIPDLDVIGFAFGIRYGDLWGHRGFTHSLTFAALLATVVVALGFRDRLHAVWPALWVYFFVVTASHGVLDAFTNGGLGVAFFSPFDTTRYFFPWRPLEVPPIGVVRMFSVWGGQVMLSEILWVWLPASVAAGIAAVLRRRRVRARP